MQPTICSRCHKNVAVVFITKIENGVTKNEGLCLKCARELGIQPIDEMIKKMGLTDEELEGLSSEMLSAFGGAEGLESLADGDNDADDGDENESEDDGRTATFPFLNRLFGNQNPASDRDQPSKEKQNHSDSAPDSQRSSSKNDRGGKRKFLEEPTGVPNFRCPRGQGAFWPLWGQVPAFCNR